jgi:hypothetical protein
MHKDLFHQHMDLLYHFSLNLVRRLVRELDHSDLGAKLKELDHLKGLVSRSASWSLVLM